MQDLTESGFGANASMHKEVSHNSQPGFDQTPSSKYAGDVTDNEGPIKDGQWQTLNFPSPAFLIALVIKAFGTEGTEELYEWQKEQLEEIRESMSWANLHKPYKLSLCAANGSGKDYIIVAPTVVWMSLTNIRCLSIITSSSGVQLTAQTENYIAALCKAVNEFAGFPVFRIRQRYIKCLLSGSEIRLFATDEEGKAEGYHPLEPNAKMAIWVNEAKSVDEMIFRALRRCTGYTHWFNVSTPGEPKGYFYKSCTEPMLFFKFRRVTYQDCRIHGKSHVSEQERIADEVDLGVTSALYRSKWLAEFTSLDTDTIIPLDQVNLCLGNKVKSGYQDMPLRIGMDLSAGGDETTLIAVRGNKLVEEVAFREKDTVLVADRMDAELKLLLGDNKKHEFIFGDDGGVGRSILDMLRHKGWEVRRVLNQSRAIRPDSYLNRCAELWYNVKRLIEERIVRLDECSDRLREQLYTRKQEKANGKLELQEKKKAKAEGLASPDRADAFVLAFCGLTLASFVRGDTETVKADEKDTITVPKARGIPLPTTDALERAIDDLAFAEFDTPPDPRGHGRRIFNSLALAQKSTNTRHLPYGEN